MQASNENKENRQLEDIALMSKLILRTSIECHGLCSVII